MKAELEADVVAIESLFGMLCGQKDCYAAWGRIRAALAESQKPSTNTQSADIAQIAAEMERYCASSIAFSSKDCLIMIDKWARQLRAGA